MPSYERTRRFDRDLRDLTPAQRKRLAKAFERFDADLATGSFRSSLRVKRVEGTDSIFEMTWAPNGRATFEYGVSQGQGAHVVWRRVGTHKVFRLPQAAHRGRPTFIDLHKAPYAFTIAPVMRRPFAWSSFWTWVTSPIRNGSTIIWASAV